MGTMTMLAGVFWRMSIQSSLLIVAVLLVRMVLIHRLPKRTFSLLWTVCVLRLLVPVFPESSFSIQSLFRAVIPRILPGNASLFGEGKGGAADGMELWISGEMAGLNETVALEAGGTPVAAVMTGIWLVGAALMGLYFTAMYIRYRRMFDMSLPLDGEMDRDNGLIRSVRLRVSDRIATPLSYGLIRPVILFPSGMNWDDREAVELVIAHETVHIRRFDGLLKGMFAGALCLHWWNPLVWAMFAFGNRDAELACDEAVVLEGEDDLRASYAMTLIRMEENRGACGVLYSHFSENAIEERITAIMKIKKTSVIAMICALCLVLGFTMVFATSAPQEDSRAENPNVSGTDPEEVKLLWPGVGCDTITMAFGERVHPVTGEKMIVNHITISDSKGEALGTEVRASEAGTVTEEGFDMEDGNYIVIDHGNGLVTKYTHCQEVWKTAGDSVERGEAIASLGQTGKVTGACLGFYVYQDGEAVDPNLYF